MGTGYDYGEILKVNTSPLLHKNLKHMGAIIEMYGNCIFKQVATKLSKDTEKDSVCRPQGQQEQT